MSTAALHGLPRWPTIAWRQIALPFAAGRVILLIAACLIPLFIEEGDISSVSGMAEEEVARRLARFARESAVVVALPYMLWIAVGWALLLWWGEGRERRRYHWAMPVTHATHDLTRVLAGAIWLAIAVTIYCVAGMLLARNDVAVSLSAYPLSLWLNIFSLPLLTYSIASIITLLANRPLEWAIGIAAVVAVLTAIAGQLVFQQLEAAANALQPTAMSLLFGKFGVGTAFMGGWHAASLEALAPYRIDPPEWPGPSLQRWLLATVVWGTIALLGVALAARKRP
jgi:hypothetical protein